MQFIKDGCITLNGQINRNFHYEVGLRDIIALINSNIRRNISNILLKRLKNELYYLILLDFYLLVIIYDLLLFVNHLIVKILYIQLHLIFIVFYILHKYII